MRCKLKPGQWVNFDGCLSRVVYVVQGFYEPYHAAVASGEETCGSRRYTEVVFKDLRNAVGRLMAGKSYMKYYEYVNSVIEPASEKDLQTIALIRERKPEWFNRWMERNDICKEEVFLGFEVERTILKQTAAKMRRLANKLPETFTWKQLVTLAAADGIDLSSCTDDYDGLDNYVSFSLIHYVGELCEKQRIFRSMKKIDFGDRVEDQLLLAEAAQKCNFESLFLFIARNTKEYLNAHTDSRVQVFFDRLHPAFTALIDGKYKKDPLANDFYRWVPKRMFSKEEAWSLAAEYLLRVDEQFGTDRVADTILESSWQEKYHWIFDVCR